MFSRRHPYKVQYGRGTHDTICTDIRHFGTESVSISESPRRNGPSQDRQIQNSTA